MKNLIPWLKLLIMGLVIGLVMRIAFYVLLSPKEISIFQDAAINWDVIKSFIAGSRFDLSALCYFSLFYWLISLFFSLNLSKNIFLIVLFFWCLLLVIDIGFYSFFNDRINILVFGFIEDDTTALIKTMWKNYPIIWIGVLLALFVWAFKKTLNGFSKAALNIKTRALVFVFLFIGARGSISMFPLGPDHTVVSSSAFLNVMSFGSAHAFARAIKLKRQQSRMGSDEWNINMKNFGYENQEDKAFEDYFEAKIPSDADRYSLMKKKTDFLSRVHKQQPHVVLLVMESWGAYGLQFQTENFDLVGELKNKLKNDLFTSNMQSATQGTAGTLSCLLSGLPQRTISSFLTESDYLNTTLSTSPALFYNKLGYDTRFIYGGNPGWRDINKFALKQGFKFVEGEVEIERLLINKNMALAGKHDWGIFDEDLFKYIELILKDAKSPQLLVVMTTSNHPPFELPRSYQKPKLDMADFPEAELIIDKDLAVKRFSTYRYSLDKLNDFINRLDLLDQDNSIRSFILSATGDHSFWLKNFLESELFLKNAVPFYIHLSKDLTSVVSKEQAETFRKSYSSQFDIWPTLYNLSTNDQDYLSFGENLFTVKYPHYSIYPERSIFSEGVQIKIDASADQDAYLVKKYRALMSSLDSYLYHAKTVQKSDRSN